MTVNTSCIEPKSTRPQPTGPGGGHLDSVIHFCSLQITKLTIPLSACELWSCLQGNLSFIVLSSLCWIHISDLTVFLLVFLMMIFPQRCRLWFVIAFKTIPISQNLFLVYCWCLALTIFNGCAFDFLAVVPVVTCCNQISLWNKTNAVCELISQITLLQWRKCYQSKIIRQSQHLLFLFSLFLYSLIHIFFLFSFFSASCSFKLMHTNKESMSFYCPYCPFCLSVSPSMVT